MAISSSRGSALRSGKGSAFQLHLEADLSEVRRGASELRHFLTASGLFEEDVWTLELAFVEACNNAVQHAPAAQCHRGIQVEAFRGADAVELRIYDHAPPFLVPDRIGLPDPAAENGRGLYLIRTLMDEVEFSRHPSGNCLLLRKALRGI